MTQDNGYFSFRASLLTEIAYSLQPKHAQVPRTGNSLSALRSTFNLSDGLTGLPSLFQKRSDFLYAVRLPRFGSREG
jgi:hypothetical protein